MGSKIEWYLVELERMLKGRVPEEALRELTTESRAHLEASVNAVTEAEDSEVAAIRSFGSPKSIALKYVRERKPLDKGVLWILLGLAVAWYAFPIWVFEIGPAGNDFFSLWGASLTLFFIVSLWLRRFKPVYIVGAVGSAAIIVTLVMSYRVYTYDDPYTMGVITISEGRKRLARAEPVPIPIDPKLYRGFNAFRPIKEVPWRIQEFRSGDKYIAPTFPAKFGGTLKWVEYPTYESARQQWTGPARTFVVIQEWNNGRTKNLKRMIATAPSPGPANFLPVGKIAFWWAGISSGILLALHAIAASVASLAEWMAIGRRQIA